MSDDDKKQVSESVDTDSDATTPQDSDEHVETSNAGHSPEDAPQHEKRTDSESDREKNKMSQLEKERNEAKKELEELRKQTSQQQQSQRKTLDDVTANELNEKFWNDRTGYEEWRKKWVASGGYDYGPHEQLYSKYKPRSERSLQQDEGQQNSADTEQQSSSLAPQDIYQIMDDKQNTDKFLENNPQYDVRKAEDEEDARNREIDLYAIRQIAVQLQARSQIRGKPISMYEALERAKISADEESLQKAEQTGITIGKAQAYASNTGAVSGVSGKSSQTLQSGDSVQLTDAQKQSYDRLLKQQGKDFADLYLKQIAQQQQ